MSSEILNILSVLLQIVLYLRIFCLRPSERDSGMIISRRHCWQAC